MGDAVTADHVRAAVVGWFDRTQAGGLKLPSGWFGRPRDNLHRLTETHVIADRLVLVLDGQMVLTLAGASEVSERHGNLVLSGFDHCVWDWTEYGSNRTHLETFTDGEVEFVKP
jgi:hypothetical protein